MKRPRMVYITKSSTRQRKTREEYHRSKDNTIDVNLLSESSLADLNVKKSNMNLLN